MLGPLPVAGWRSFEKGLIVGDKRPTSLGSVITGVIVAGPPGVSAEADLDLDPDVVADAWYLGVLGWRWMEGGAGRGVRKLGSITVVASSNKNSSAALWEG